MSAIEPDHFDFSPSSIRNRREQLGLTREVVALAVGKSVGAVISWERGDRTPGPRTKSLLAATLDVVDVADDAAHAALERARNWTDESRKAQGLPPTVEDDAAAEEIACALRGDAQ